MRSSGRFRYQMTLAWNGVRIELLNLGAEYAWLDVLCLRQKGDDKLESRRKQEWRTDVPTIGVLYQQQSYTSQQLSPCSVKAIVSYYSGLGRPLSFDNLDNPRHWFNRAWTLQEGHMTSTTAGVTKDPRKSRIRYSTGFEERRKGDSLTSPSQVYTYGRRNATFKVLSVMIKRFAETKLDKIAGLSYLLLDLSTRPCYVPFYDEDQSAEDAWDDLLRTTGSSVLGDMLFLYPYPGPPNHTWAPSWAQINDPNRRLPLSEESLKAHVELQLVGSKSERPRHIARYEGYRIDKCRVEGFENGTESASEDQIPSRTGTVVIGSHRFEAFALHGQAIDKDGLYTMVGNSLEVEWRAGLGEYWVLGRMEGSGRIKKLSILRMRKAVADKIVRLGLGRSREDCEFS